MNPIYTAFYTRNSIYERESQRLIRSLDRLGLEHDIRAVDSCGDWIANTKLTATHICTMLDAYPDRPVVQLDADAVVWKRPELFDTLGETGADIAVHYRRGVELLNGTIWFNATPGAKLAARKYRELIQNHPGCSNEQTMLSVALKELGGAVNVYRLPAGYTWIHDIMKDDLAIGEDPVIEHLQCSRTTHVSNLTDNRNRRLLELQYLGIELPHEPE